MYSKPNFIKSLIIFSRMLVGFVFIFSGFVKGIDPMGSAYKFQDYFDVFNLNFLHNFALIFAIVLSSLEFIVGISLFFGLRTRIGSWGALLFMIIFTPLTLILALSNPVDDCGCFGDAVVLTNWQTFWKNLFLMVFTLVTIWGRKKFISIYKSATEWIVVTAFLVFIGGISGYGLIHLPVIDFRPYSIGSSIVEGMTIPEGAAQDQYKTTLIYEKNGIQKEFSDNDFPWQDSSWSFVDQKSILINEGYQTPIHDFNIVSSHGEDITYQVLDNPDFSFLVVCKSLSESRLESLNLINELALYFLQRDIPFYGLSSSNSSEIESFWTNSDPFFDFYSCDETTLKTIIRSNPGLLLLKDGTILAKWSWRDIPTTDEFSGQLLSEQITMLRKDRDKWKIYSLFLSIFLLWSLAASFVPYKNER
ncbi:MAG: DoxX family protein [Bacteroidota bacterium]|nr:DoxX family protein [Bacteroidota bacterium]